MPVAPQLLPEGWTWGSRSHLDWRRSFPHLFQSWVCAWAVPVAGLLEAQGEARPAVTCSARHARSTSRECPLAARWTVKPCFCVGDCLDTSVRSAWASVGWVNGEMSGSSPSPNTRGEWPQRMAPCWLFGQLGCFFPGCWAGLIFFSFKHPPAPVCW